MNGILDNALVGLALVVSAAYALISLGPKSLRRRLFGALGRVTARAPGLLHLRRAAQWFAAASKDKAQGACGGCDNCGSEPAAAPTSPQPEVKVPLANIGRRNSVPLKSSEPVGSDLP
jgi:hypothetical protein